MASNRDEPVQIRVRDEESRVFLRTMTLLGAFGGALILLYSLRFWASGQLLCIFSVGMLVAGAALLSGFLLGFIFAIPRVGDQKRRTKVTETEAAQAPDSGAQTDSMPFNANLVEISDWLTKIIVGVGLVELHSIPSKLGELSYYLAPSLLPIRSTEGAFSTEPLVGGQAAGLAILIFYFTLGFLVGYVWTMIYFQRDLKGQLKQTEQQRDTERQLKQAAILIMRAEASINADRLDEAMASVDEAIENDPRNGFAVMTKARILKRQALQPGQSDRDMMLKQALAYVDQAIALLPDKGEPIYNRACYQALLDLSSLKNSVLENLKSAFRLNPDLRQIAKDDDDLASLRKDAYFVTLIS